MLFCKRMVSDCDIRFQMSNMQNLKDKDVGATLERLNEKLADDIKL